MTEPAQLVVREDDGESLSTLVWRFDEPVQCVSTAAVGGGWSEPAWLVNAQVPHGYHRVDLVDHAHQIASSLGLVGSGVVMLTAVDVHDHESATVDGVTVHATVGVSDPVWAADPSLAAEALPTVGTVNIVVQLPLPATPAALVNLVATVTEAKCQAFVDRQLPGTGTPTDAVTVLSPRDGATADLFGGPRSPLGRRAALAAYQAITAGLPRC